MHLHLHPHIHTAPAMIIIMVQMSVEPRFLAAYMRIGQDSELQVQDAGAFCAEGERLSFLQLQARAESVRQVLMGYYRIPATTAQPLELVINPQVCARLKRCFCSVLIVHALDARSSARQLMCCRMPLPCTHATHAPERSAPPLPLPPLQGVEERRREQVWNVGDARCKLVTMAARPESERRQRVFAADGGAAAAADFGGSSGEEAVWSQATQSGSMD